MRCIPTVNVDRLKPFFARDDEPPPPGPVTAYLTLDRKESTKWSCCSTAACSAT